MCWHAKFHVDSLPSSGSFDLAWCVLDNIIGLNEITWQSILWNGMDREWLDGVYHMLQLILIVKCLIVLRDKVVFFAFVLIVCFDYHDWKLSDLHLRFISVFGFYFLWFLLLFLIMLKSAWGWCSVAKVQGTASTACFKTSMYCIKKAYVCNLVPYTFTAAFAVYYL